MASVNFSASKSWNVLLFSGEMTQGTSENDSFWNSVSPLGTYFVFIAVLTYAIVNHSGTWIHFILLRICGIKYNIFYEDARKPRGTSHKPPEDREEVLRPPLLSMDKMEQLNPDVTIIGGGTSGLIAAATLSKTGYKVVVLEQHYILGGGCHTFKEGRFDFDTGFHYVGEMNSKESFQILDQLTEGQIEWYPMDEVFDKLEFGKYSETSKPHVMKIRATFEKWREELKQCFPGYEIEIDKFEKLIRNFEKAAFGFGFLKLAPKFFANLIMKIGSSRIFPSWFKFYFTNTADEQFTKLTNNKNLLACFRYIYGTLACPPKKLTLFFNAAVMSHYIDSGGFYPKHGPSIIPYHLVRVINKNGGHCFVRSKVDSLVLKAKGGGLICEGVNVAVSKRMFTLNSKHVISSAGFCNTFHKMMDAQVVDVACPDIKFIKSEMKPSVGCLNLFVGLSASGEELGLIAQNTWMFDNYDIEELYQKWINETDPWKAIDELSFPFLYVGFPSAKDKSYKYNHADTSTCVVITFCPYSWFQDWNDRPVGKRGDTYETLKDALRNKMWERVLQSFPQLEDKVELFSLGTPVTSNFYFNADNGEVYGMDHGAYRYTQKFTLASRFKTEIEGLYVSGQDTWCCGFVPAIITGVLTSAAITKRRYLTDIQNLYKN